MGTPPISDDVLEQSVAAYVLAGRNQTAAARELGVARETLQNRLKRAAERGLLGPKEALPGYAVKSLTTKAADGSIVKFTKEAGPEYEPTSGLEVKGKTTWVNAEGRVTQQVVMERKGAEDRAALAAALHEEFGQYKGYAKLVRPPKETYADLCNYYPIVDPHIGMLAHVKETGESNDLKIGVSRVGGTLHRLIGESPPAETGVIINTGDFFHADDQRNVTPASGHQLDVDGRSHKVKWAGVNMLRTTIDLALQRHIVKNLKGNHDPESAMWLNIALGLFYSNEERVEIDTEDANNDHFFHLFGVNYTGATHGHTMRPDRMYVMMAEDNPEYWNASLYRWCIFGHIHHETKKQIGSLICESFSQPVPRDSFAHSHGYRSGSAMQSITLHKQDGESGRVIKRFPPSRGLPVAANDNEERKAA